jgi:hypothetical protein
MKQLFAGLALAAACLAAQAYELTFTGRVTYTDGSLSGVTVGGTVQGSFKGENPQAFVPFPGFPNIVVYGFDSALVSVSVAGHTIASKGGEISILDNFGGNVEDHFEVFGAPITIDGVNFASGTVSFALASKPGSTGALASAALPSQINLAAFDALTWNQGVVLRNGAQGGTVFGYQILSVNVSAVPEPTSAWLVLAGGLALAAFRRRQAPSLHAAVA